MYSLDDDDCFDFIADKMRNVCKIDTTIEEDMQVYAGFDHENFFTSDMGGFLCITYLPDCVWVAYAYKDGRYSTLKEMVTFAKSLYKRYTITNNLPIYYTGLSNLYGNHSIKINQQLWKLHIKG